METEDVMMGAYIAMSRAWRVDVSGFHFVFDTI